MMGIVEQRIAARDLTLPPAALAPPGVALPFSWVRVHGNRAYASGHGALTASGEVAEPRGKVPSEVSLEQAQRAATAAMLALISGFQRALGDLDRITAWLTVTGCVNADAGFGQTTLVLNPASELVLDLFGPDCGQHARTALGYAALPLNMPVVIAAEVAIDDRA